MGEWTKNNYSEQSFCSNGQHLQVCSVFCFYTQVYTQLDLLCPSNDLQKNKSKNVDPNVSEDQITPWLFFNQVQSLWIESEGSVVVVSPSQWLLAHPLLALVSGEGQECKLLFFMASLFSAGDLKAFL